MAALEYSENYARMGSFSNKVHNCKICPFFSTSVFRMVNHVRTHRSPLTHFSCEKSNVELYFCKDCNFQTNLTLLMKKHIKNYHSSHPQNASNSLEEEEDENRSYICKKCGFETYFLLKWLQHGQKCDNDVFTEIKDLCVSEKHKTKPNAEYKCDQCSYKATQKQNLRRHTMNLHQRDQIEKFQCYQCLYKTTRKDNLRAHIRNLHQRDQIKQLQGDQRSYKATRKDYLKRHIMNMHEPHPQKLYTLDQITNNKKS